MKLQQHFTTPEQSKRLLKLGVPKNTADCIFNHKQQPKVIEQGFDFESEAFALRAIGVKEVLPCWSLGRLMEITELYAAAHRIVDWAFNLDRTTYIKGVIFVIEKLAKNYNVDFSKLEEML